MAVYDTDMYIDGVINKYIYHIIYICEIRFCDDFAETHCWTVWHEHMIKNGCADLGSLGLWLHGPLRFPRRRNPSD